MRFLFWVQRGNALQVAISDMNDCLAKNVQIMCSAALALAAPGE